MPGPKTDVTHPNSPEIVLDISRLISRSGHQTPTGVDRVEMAYARELLRAVPDRLEFGAVHPSGFYGRLPKATVIRFLQATEDAWRGARTRRKGRMRALAGLLRTWWMMRPRRVPKAGRARIVLHSSPHHLQNQSLTETIVRRENGRFICLIHDLIPIEYPEYARPRSRDAHVRRMKTVARLADGIVTNSEATRISFLPHLAAQYRSPPVRVLHLGTMPSSERSKPDRRRPYFVCLGTIEARKNHLLLLNIWRRLAEQKGAGAIPQLIIIGRRGWENEQVVDMLERCPALAGCVEEHSSMSDSEVWTIMSDARALLLPSFAEGFGMPVSEALAHNVPVVCSDLPALREVGGDVPDYLDPLDGPAWVTAVLDYAVAGSVRRDAQLARLRHWQAPTWAAHIEGLLGLIEEIGDA